MYKYKQKDYISTKTSEKFLSLIIDKSFLLTKKKQREEEPVDNAKIETSLQEKSCEPCTT